MCAFSVEGIANEILPVLEASGKRLNTTAKWQTMHKHFGGAPFVQGAEPLQTITYLMEKRDRIVHPKGMGADHDFIVCSADGRVQRNASPDYVLQDGDRVFFAYEKLLVDFNADAARRAAVRTFSAFRVIQRKVSGNLVQWIDALASHFPWLEQPSPSRPPS
jgi:hypothetical protein